MKGKALIFAAIGEIATGAALLLVPLLVGRLLLGVDFADAAIVLARVAGIALIALGIACWPGTPMRAMLVYSAGATVCLAYAGMSGVAGGVLLWPAVALHAILSLILAWPPPATRSAPGQ